MVEGDLLSKFKQKKYPNKGIPNKACFVLNTNDIKMLLTNIVHLQKPVSQYALEIKQLVSTDHPGKYDWLSKFQQKSHPPKSYLFYVSKTMLIQRSKNIIASTLCNCVEQVNICLLVQTQKQKVQLLLLKKISFCNFQLAKFLKPSYHFLYNAL